MCALIALSRRGFQVSISPNAHQSHAPETAFEEMPLISLRIF